jgi:hypothetical protein
MSGLYNALFGENGSQKEFLLKVLGKSTGDFGRYRDIYVTADHIVVHTRCGGGNRDDYQYVFEEMEEHPLYAYDEDSDFDSTYADIYFFHPPECAEVLKEMSVGTVTPAEKWRMLFAAIDSSK